MELNGSAKELSVVCKAFTIGLNTKSFTYRLYIAYLLYPLALQNLWTKKEYLE